jgi:TetR/AcrR family transcriptional regulator, transcriptional repressor for nem operon
VKSRSNDQKSTAQLILDAAEQLAQRRGFNGFSYADIAEKLGVTKASLHYHFPSKADLGARLIARYHETFADALTDIDATVDDEAEKLRRYVALYDEVISHDRMCLCGVFAAEYTTLPVLMQVELRAFFDANEVWLASVLEHGRESGRLNVRESPRAHARILVEILEGAMLVARAYSDLGRFRATADHALAELGVGVTA